MAELAIKFISGRYQGGEFPLPDDGELLVGRASDLDIVLVEDMVSRKHAKMTAQAGFLTITDLGSTNGTFVNGEKVRRATLNANDRVLIGTSILRIISASEMSRSQDVPADRVAFKSAMREMMEELASRAGPESSTMSGDLEEVPLPDLLQLFATNKKSGVFTIDGAHRGKIYINQGQIQYAIIGQEESMTAMKALCRMVKWEKGAFRLDPYDDTAKFPETFKEPTESILIEALRQTDEIRKMLDDMPELNSEMALCVPLTPKLSDLDPQELDILQLALNFVSLQQVLDRSPATDHQALTHLQRLMRDGYLEVS